MSRMFMSPKNPGLLRGMLLAIAAMMVGCGGAAGQLAPLTNGLKSTTPFVSTGDTYALTLADLFGGWRASVRASGATATGLGGTDDTPAFARAINKAITNYALGLPADVIIEPGAYYLNNTIPLPTAYHVPVRFIGSGSTNTSIYLGPNYSGDVFSFSEDWSASAFNGPASPSQPNDWNGASVIGVHILGSQNYSNVQNAISLYDRNDHVYISDVIIDSLHGSCLNIGTAKNTTVSYTRESYFADLQCFSSGISGSPAVTISSTASGSSDSTNELDFYKLSIFGAKGSGLLISSPQAGASTRLLNFFGIRVEDSIAGDNIDIGAASDLGGISAVQMTGMQSINSQSGYYDLAFNGNGSDANSYGIVVQGFFGPGPGNGVYFGSGHADTIDLTDNAASGTLFTFASGKSASGNDVAFIGAGAYQNGVGQPYMRGGSFNTGITVPSLTETALPAALLATNSSGLHISATQSNLPSTRVCTLYTTPGTFTYSGQSWANSYDLYVTGAGASGANGAVAALGTATSGGAGGSGGSKMSSIGVPASTLTLPLIVFIAAGGASPSGAGAQGNPGGQSYIITSSNQNLFTLNGNGAGSSSGGSTTNNASGGPGGPYGNGTNASGATSGVTPYGPSGASGGTGGWGNYPGWAAAGSGGTVAVAGVYGAMSYDSGGGGASGGGVSVAGVAQNGGGSPAIQSFGNSYAGIAPGGAGGTVPPTVWPGVAPRGGPGGAGGDATHAGGNGNTGSGPGAGGGGGGSTITGNAAGIGAPGQNGAAEICANR